MTGIAKRNEEQPKATESEITFTTAQMALFLDVTPRRVQQLAEEGVLVKEGRGKYKAVESIRGYIRSLSVKEEGRTGDVNFYEEQAKHEKAKREIAELKLAVMKGELHQSSDVEYVMNDMIAAFRARCLSLPSKVAPQIVGLTELPPVLAMLEREIHEALSELSEYDPHEFLAKSEGYVGLIPDEEG